jgi:hypothetical protein
VIFGTTVTPMGANAWLLPPEVASAELNVWAPPDNLVVERVQEPLPLTISEPSGSVASELLTWLPLPGNNTGTLASPLLIIPAFSENDEIKNGMINRATIKLVLLHQSFPNAR